MEKIKSLIKKPITKWIITGFIGGSVITGEIKDLSTDNVVEIYAKTRACISSVDAQYDYKKLRYCACKVKYDVSGLLSATDSELRECREES